MAVSIEADNSDSVSLNQLFGVIWSGKWVIIAVTSACTLLAGVAASVLPKQYEAQSVVAPVSSGSAGAIGAMGSVASQLGGLASLAGISIGADEKETESIAVLQSEALTESYIRDNNLLPVLYADLWDSTRGEWKPMEADQAPTLWKATRFFRTSVRRVKTDGATGLVTITVTWKDPELAAKWANGLVALANEYLRAKAIDESQLNIAYLNQEAQRTDLVGAKEAIYAILQNEINKGMLARGRAEYAFKVIDPAKPPEIKSSPIKLLWLVAGLVFGMFLSILYVFVRATWR
ncbi:MAG: Wzz/FepE/Etk N-terminal domain-containing protein [Steroidobacter sp.]